MTLRDLLRTIGRRWYMVVLAFALAALAFVGFASGGGVYATKPILAFVYADARLVAPDNGLENEGVLAFASTVAQAINQGRPIERYAADDAPLYGAGAREEVRVGVPNVGGQWGVSYTRAEIAISIVGRTEEYVGRTQRELIAEVRAIADREQALRDVPPADRLIPHVVPLSTQIEWVGSSSLQRLMAGAALAVAALIVGGGSAVAVDRVFSSRGRRRTRRRDPFVQGANGMRDKGGVALS